MRVLSEQAVREIVDAARRTAEQARQASLAAQSRLQIIKSEAYAAAARLKKLRANGSALDDLGSAPDDLGRPT